MSDQINTMNPYENTIVTAIHLLHINGLYMEASDIVMKHCEKNKIHKTCYSKPFEIKSVIDEYIFKKGARKGQKTKAHYTIYGNFIEIDNSPNPQPKYYIGLFPWNYFKFTFNSDANCITDFLTPKTTPILPHLN